MKWKIVKYFGFVLIFLIIITGIGSIIIINHYYKELPNVSELVENYTPAIPTVIYDKNGQIIDVISKEVREPTTIENMPLSIQNAFIAIEDKRFRTHYGIDPIRILGSAVINLKTGKFSQGGSTITQQLARNAFLTLERKLSRKIKEIIITFEIERKYTKDEIMEKYLNEIYFGSGAYGVKTAAHNFFRKDIKNINLAESALLAGIPNRPNLYNPRINLKQSLSRQRLILNQMLKYQLITKQDYIKAINHKFINQKNATKPDYDNKNITIIYNSIDKKIEFNAPDFTDMVEKFLFENFNDKQIYNDGLKVYTTLDLNIQKSAKNIFENYYRLKADKKLQGAMVTIDAKNGEIVSIIGGKNYKTGNFNRVIQAKRQFGSSFKPFIYFTALEKGYEENLIVEDSRILYNTWAPRNYGNRYYYGMTLMQGFDKSQNIVSIKLLEKIGLKSLKNTIKKIGIDFSMSNDLTVAIGTTEGTPLSLAQAYAIFANGGYSVKPMYILKITDKLGNILYEGKPTIQQKFNSKNISLMTNMLKNSVKSGTSRAARVKINGKYIPQGGKTGTTNGSRTIWYAGITPDFVTVIYMGYDDNSKLYKATGGGVVAPLWKKFYQDIIKKDYYKPTTFDFLDNYVENGDLIYQYLNPFSGLLTKSNQKKLFLIRRGKVVVETDLKYKNGIKGVLQHLSYSDDSNEIIKIQKKNEEFNKNLIENKIPERKIEKKSFFKRLFGF